MKEFGKQYRRSIENIKSIFGKEYKDPDQIKYSTILNSVPYPDLENDPEAVVDQAVTAVQEALQPNLPSYKGTPFRQGLEISRLGKPKG